MTIPTSLGGWTQPEQVVQTLLVPGRPALIGAYTPLVELVATVSPRQLRQAQAAHMTRLSEVAIRLAFPGRPIAGLTTHR
jgi:DNA helicase-2/ATP-dependent DNA helicase PcrA